MSFFLIEDVQYTLFPVILIPIHRGGSGLGRGALRLL